MHICNLSISIINFVLKVKSNLELEKCRATDLYGHSLYKTHKHKEKKYIHIENKMICHASCMYAQSCYCCKWKETRGFLHISYNNAALFTHRLLSLFIFAMSQTERFAGPNTTSLSLEFQSASGLPEQIRSIRGTRLLPPDIEREFTSTRRPSASELILTCHSVMAHARSMSSLLLPVRPFAGFLTPS